MLSHFFLQSFNFGIVILLDWLQPKSREPIISLNLTCSWRRSETVMPLLLEWVRPWTQQCRPQLQLDSLTEHSASKTVKLKAYISHTFKSNKITKNRPSAYTCHKGGEFFYTQICLLQLDPLRVPGKYLSSDKK